MAATSKSRIDSTLPVEDTGYALPAKTMRADGLEIYNIPLLRREVPMFPSNHERPNVAPRVTQRVSAEVK